MNATATRLKRREYLSKVGLNQEHLWDWGIKWRNFKANAEGRGKVCNLTFEQYIDLAVIAGISDPSQIGTDINKYHMCRVGDIGDYVIGNCSFKPHSENALERKINGGARSQSDKMKGRKADTHDHVKKVAHAISKEYLVKSPAGEVFRGRNLSNLCREYGLGSGNMSLVCNGKKTSHKGWTGRYIDADII